MPELYVFITPLTVATQKNGEPKLSVAFIHCARCHLASSFTFRIGRSVLESKGGGNDRGGGRMGAGFVAVGLVGLNGFDGADRLTMSNYKLQVPL